MFSNAKPDSIFGRLSSLVSKDDKETGLGEAIKKIKTTEDKLTLFYGKPGMMNHPELGLLPLQVFPPSSDTNPHELQSSC